jgi:hypothetical protein
LSYFGEAINDEESTLCIVHGVSGIGNGAGVVGGGYVWASGGTVNVGGIEFHGGFVSRSKFGYG